MRRFLVAVACSIVFLVCPASAVAANPSLYWGAYIHGADYGINPATGQNYGDTPWDSATWDLFESHAGKGVSILHWGQAWHWLGENGYSTIGDGHFQRFYPGNFDKVRNRGVIPLIDWSSADLTAVPYETQTNYSLSAITSGTYDAYIRQWATDAKAWGKPFFLRFDWEMNGNWYPWSEQKNGNSTGQYVTMWRHVHDIFTSVGATNVSWVWCPNLHYSGATAMAGLYPGDAYVDWICLDGYNKGTTNQTFSQLYTSSYQTITQIAPSKPLIIGEIASNEYGSGQKATWITDSLQTQIPTNFPKIKAVLWFNWNSDAGSSFRIESSTASQTAFANAITSPVYAGSTFGNITGLIQPLAVTTPTVTPLPTPTTSQPISSNNIYWGAYVKGNTYGLADPPWDWSAINTFEAHAGKKMSLFQSVLAAWSNSAGYIAFSTSQMNLIRNAGYIPYLDWQSRMSGGASNTNQPAYSLQAIIRGDHDAYITQWATAAKGWGYPFFLRFDAEMNGSWWAWSETNNGQSINGNHTGEFVQAWRHVHDIFTAVGNTNATWVWCPNVDYPGSIALEGLYPGDAYVDWTCMDGYNWGTGNTSHIDTWKNFTQVMKPTYDHLLVIAPTKPIFIGEFGSDEVGGSKASWITDALTVQLPTFFPKVKAISWFNNNVDGANWWIESSTSSQNAFAQGIALPYYSTNVYTQLPTGKKIVPLVIGDTNGDGQVDLVDLVLLLSRFTNQTSLRQSDGDFNFDTKINSFDFGWWVKFKN